MIDCETQNFASLLGLIAVGEVGMWDVESRITHKKC